MDELLWRVLAYCRLAFMKIFSGATPFIGLNSFMAMLVITQGKRPPRPTHPTFRDNLWRLTQQCWNGDPRLRPEVSEALKVLLTPSVPRPL